MTTQTEALKLVPLEPTNNMKSAASQLFAKNSKATPSDFYKVMVAAAKEALSQPEQEPQKGGCTWCGGDCPQFECDTHSTWMNEPVIRRDMTAHSAVYFMERFKHEEKLLGPNEQAALDFVISMLEAQPEPVAHFGSAYINENGVHITTVLGPVAIPQDAKLYTDQPRSKPPMDEPTLFWNDADPEQPHSSIDEFLNHEWCRGCLEVSDIRTVQRAIRLPNETIRVTAVTDSGDIEYETVEAADIIKGDA